MTSLRSAFTLGVIIGAGLATGLAFAEPSSAPREPTRAFADELKRPLTPFTFPRVMPAYPAVEASGDAAPAPRSPLSQISPAARLTPAQFWPVPRSSDR